MHKCDFGMWKYSTLMSYVFDFVLSSGSSSVYWTIEIYNVIVFIDIILECNSNIKLVCDVIFNYNLTFELF